MADITLKYLTELTAATSVDANDLIHINQGGNDRSVTASVLRAFMINAIYPVGVTLFFATNQNPNNLFPNTRWQRINGYGRTIRLANEAMSDVLETGGSDSVTLSVDNIPSHSHGFSGNTSSYDHGTRTTSTNGNHNHGIEHRVNNYANSTGGNDVMKTGGGTTFYTKDSGEHSHTVQIGSHSHSFSGTTGSTGGGQSFITKNEYINLIAWYRVS
ncbi:hypothetical protein SAMN05216522_10527 [Rosenbergiella nectarea]|uniref:Baseplate structural protein Gp10 C-terminal domain-containing protein n=1 Tax=Rosenbergiella nectarea TaxID=988801 RepID=A0A1H9HRC9_9GAMM|nr:hypothetical protein [Rosenbergiella nectarea]SEQ64836.1 hypothetical protein SAMN05216522_10527 [Rosenbergiella nectarea]